MRRPDVATLNVIWVMMESEPKDDAQSQTYILLINFEDTKLYIITKLWHWLQKT